MPNGFLAGDRQSLLSSGTKTCTSTGGRALTQTSDKRSKDQTTLPVHNPGAAFDDARIRTTGWDSDVAFVLGPRECQDG